MTELNIHTTVADFVCDRPSRSRLFEGLGIDYCCGGKRPLTEVCAERGIDAQALLETLVAAGESTPGGDTCEDLTRMSPAELIAHIVEVHHKHLRSELPRMSELGAHVASHHGDRELRLASVAALFDSLRADLEAHMDTEEKVLFPALLATSEQGAASTGANRSSLRELTTALEGEHRETATVLEELRALTDGFTVPDWGCNSFRALYDGLRELERDIHEHVHEENNILFPMVSGG